MLATKVVFRSNITENDSKLKPDKNKLGRRPRVTTGRVIALGTSCQGKRWVVSGFGQTEVQGLWWWKWVNFDGSAIFKRSDWPI